MVYNAFLKIDNILGSELAKNIKERIQKDGEWSVMKILVQEQNGDPVSGFANYADPHMPAFCDRIGCFLCTTAKRPTLGKCWKPVSV